MEIGLYTFGEVTHDPETGRQLNAAERLRDLLEEIELADQVGLAVYAVGEHHRPDYAVSSPAVVLAAAAERTKQIRLSSAVNVLSSDDPIRVFQQFATLDLLSGGRAEIMAGRGSFIESFPLFGYDLKDYDALFDEKLQLLLRIRESEKVKWPGGRHTQPIDNRGVYPRPIQSPLPVWVAVGGTPESAARAGLLGLPMALAIIGGQPARFAPFAEIFRAASERAGHKGLPLSINSHGLIAENSQTAADTVFPAMKATMDRIGHERGWGPLSREQFDNSRMLEGANFVGSPAEIVDKILYQHEIFQHERFLIQFTVGTLPHAAVMHSIELLGTQVAPQVERGVGEQDGWGADRPLTREIANRHWSDAFEALVDDLGGEFRRFGAVYAFLGNLPLPFANGCLVLDDADPNDLDAAVTWVESGHVPFQVRVDDTVLSRLARTIAERGLVEEPPPMPAMVLHPIPDPPAPAPRVTVSAVQPDTYEDFLGILVASGISAKWAPLIFPRRWIGLEGQRYFVAQLDDRPVGISVAVHTGESGGIYSVATIEEARRRGVGSAVTWAAVAAIRDWGCTSAVLQSSGMGYPVYRAMGFEEVTRYVRFNPA